MTNSVNLRAVVLDVLMEINEHDSYSHLVIRQALNKYQYLDKNERAFITRLASGTIEKQIELDYIINSFSKTPVRKMKPLIRNILRMSVYQLKYMSHVPDSAVCNEAAKLTGKRGLTGLKGFVNGVLRNIARNIENVEYPIREKKPLQYLSVVYSMPEWILKQWLTVYPFETVEKILQSFDKERVTYIRTNRTKITPEQLKTKLEEEGVTVKQAPFVDYAFEISGYDYLADLESFQQGLFQIQDLSSMIAGRAAAPQAGEYIIDVCAAPGGKCIHAAENILFDSKQRGEQKCDGFVDARDLSEAKTEIIEENIARMQTENISVKVWDARIPDEAVIEKADVVLADLPCSGLGIIGRKADIKYKMTEEKQKDLVKLQREILHTIEQYVKPGGRLIYSTCTINSAENFENVNWLLQNYNFELESLSEELPYLKDEETVQNGYIQLLPGMYHTDGFFIAKLRKKR